MSPLRWLISGLVLSGLWACDEADPNTEAAQAVRPDVPVILISIDTLRADRLTPYGAKRDTSPFLDWVAREGVTFAHCAAQSTSTGPSHRSLFTGQYVHRHGHLMKEYTISPYTMASLLQSVGYETAGFVGGGFLSPELGFGRGFDVYRHEDDDTPEDQRNRHRGWRTVLPQARRWLEARSQRNPSAPLFLFLHSYDTHCPYWPEVESVRNQWAGWYRGELDLRTLCGRGNFARLYEDGQDVPREDRDYLEAMYDGEIRVSDARLGRFLERMRQDGSLDRALLIVTSDHGESLGEHRTIGHTLMWEEQIQVPLILRFPGGQYGGQFLQEPAMLIDVLPTLIDFLGMPEPPGVQGASLMPMIRGERSWLTGDVGDEAPLHTRMILSEHEELYSVRFDHRWKLIWTLHEGEVQEPMLFDLVADPNEEHNLISNPEGQARFENLHRRYLEFRTRTEAEDRRFRGSPLGDALNPGLMEEISELGYAGFEND